jgi:hypothetical protein
MCHLINGRIRKEEKREESQKKHEEQGAEEGAAEDLAYLFLCGKQTTSNLSE